MDVPTNAKNKVYFITDIHKYFYKKTKPYSINKKDQMIEYRDKVIKEIEQTERYYVEQLELVTNVSNIKHDEKTIFFLKKYHRTI